MANKLISAESLLLSVRDDPEIDGKHFARFKEHINHAPDVVKHGRWICHWCYGKTGKRVYRYTCSVCNALGSPHWKVCPVCEARMDGENDA